MDIAIEFQKELFKFLATERTMKNIMVEFDATVFDLTEYQLTFKLLQKCVAKIKRLPTKADFLQYITTQLPKLKWDEKVEAEIFATAKMLYTPIYASKELLTETAVEFAQYQMMKKAAEKYIPTLQDGVEIWRSFKNDITKILAIGTSGGSDHAEPTSVFDEWDEAFSEYGQTHPCYLNGLNKLTAKRGFASPELILILGLPKGFKTGTMINLGVNYAIAGLKVFCVDFENGQKAYRQRIKQALLQCTRQELQEEEPEHINNCLQFWKLKGGNIFVQSYTAYANTPKDVEADLDYLREVHGFIPDVILWDYPDIINPSDTSIKETRHKIQHVYHEIISLNKRLGCFSFAASHTTKSAVGKFNYDMGDFSEDWGKAKNCHATFGIMQSPEEAEAGVARLGVVLQREGVKSGTIFVNIDESRQLMEEIDEAEYQNSND